VEPHLKPGLQILEIGCGPGVLTAFRRAEGHDVLGIEPGDEGGFGFMPALQRAMARELDAGERPEIEPLPAEGLDADEHGRFDLMFSVNVLEHVFALEEAIRALAAVLAPDGRMIHTCPNYAFPYEPHLSIPLVPGAPRLTRFLLRRSVRRQRRVWDTVSFVTARRLRKLSHRAELDCELEPGTTARAFSRLADDPVFRRRHAGWLARIARTPVVGSAVGGLLRAIPSSLATPMVAQMTHRARTEP
jgi:SAM-dependent methyltransferase